MHLHHILTSALGSSRYRDANPVPTNPFANDLANAPFGPVPLVDMYSSKTVGMVLEGGGDDYDGNTNHDGDKNSI